MGQRVEWLKLCLLAAKGGIGGGHVLGTGKPSCSNCSCLMKSQEVKFYGSHKS